jgi:hypothetical protein
LGHPSGAGDKQAAETLLFWLLAAEEDIPQGLKPIDFIAIIGTTEVVPFQSGEEAGFFRCV